MGRALGMKRGNENFLLRLKSSKEDYIRNPGVDWIIMLKWILYLFLYLEGSLNR